MRTARSSSRHGGGGGVGLDQIPLNFPLECGPGPDPPQLPPWVWALTRSPSTSPLGVGLETCNACRITDTCKNITLPQTSFAGGNYPEKKLWLEKYASYKEN